MDPNKPQMDPNKPQTVIATYRVQTGKEAQFEELLSIHYPTLRRRGLVTEEPPLILRGEEEGAPIYYEIFSWVDGVAPQIVLDAPDDILHRLALTHLLGMQRTRGLRAIYQRIKNEVARQVE